jgi:hypothetical protein
MDLFEVDASEYWNDHFVFGKRSRNSVKHTGSQAVNILLINAVIPVIFVYGKWRDDYRICERSLAFLEGLPSEENSVLEEWKNSGVKAESSFYSQALIELRNEYCKKRRCLDCRIGNSLVSMGKKLREQDELILEP